MSPRSRPPFGDFPSTHWSAVLRAGGQASDSLAELCQAYWPPLYRYARRRLADEHQAQDATQAFFARLLEKGDLASADPSRGRFRAFLLTAFKSFLANERDKARALKRGGGRRPLSIDFAAEQGRPFDLRGGESPEQIYQRAWALTLLRRVLEALEDECRERGKAELFERLRPALAGEDIDRAAAARELGLESGALRVALHRLRRRYRELLRFEVASTLDDIDGIDDELQALFRALG